jgi:hypothetical protein
MRLPYNHRRLTNARMDGTERNIEIFKPFGQAFELMKKILFQPFDFTKWLVIGFAAFLAGHFGAGGFSFPSPSRNVFFQQSQTAARLNFEQWKPWLPVIIIGFVIFVLALVIVLMWLRSRGSFIFTDCIVRNRGAIIEPWREYRTEGNSYFVFQLLVMLVAMAAVVVLAIVFVLLGFLAGGHRELSGVVMAALLVPLFICWIAFSILINLIFLFMAPVMYRQRCPAPDAATQVLRLIFANPAPFILFCLFGIVLVLSMLVIGCAVTCATCCIGALPYVGTVILLPVFVTLRSFSLLFLRQFGSDYDMWASLVPPEFLPILSPASPAPPPSTSALNAPPEPRLPPAG